MPVNANKPERWKADIAKSVDFYNDWFMRFAPKAYRDIRVKTTEQVLSALGITGNLTDIGAEILQQNPFVLPILRMSTAPPIARDRLIGLAGVTPHLVKSMEIHQRIPPRMRESQINVELQKVGQVILRLVDEDLFPWVVPNYEPDEKEKQRAATVVADRLCGAMTDPIIRNAQEQRQLTTMKVWLEKRGYVQVEPGDGAQFDTIEPGSFAFRLNIPVRQEGREKQVNLPADVVVMPCGAKPGDFPLLIEAKSAGDFANTNKRRKEEAIKIAQLRHTYGDRVQFILFLCGYFDSGYLGYEAAEGIDWVWEHRIDDLAEFGI
jgi:hypothetical protein